MWSCCRFISPINRTGWRSFPFASAWGAQIWAWLYETTGALYASWISHLLIDAAIFAIGYHMAFVAR